MANIPTFEALMQGFGVVTVMNVCIYEKDGTYTSGGVCCKIADGSDDSDDSAFSPSDWKETGEKIDTLKIANLNQEGPTKTITGGQYSNPLIKYGKTTTLEMQDALGRASTLVRFFGCDLTTGTNGARLSVTDRFPAPFAMEGTTFFIDQATGSKKWVYVLIPQFIPDAILNLAQDAEGDAAVFDLNGSVAVTRIKDGDGDEARDIFYEIREKSFFLDGTETAIPKN